MENNTISAYEIVFDRYGKKHKVFSARFKDMQTITNFTEKYNPDAFYMYMLAPVTDEDGNIEHDKNGNINYNNGFIDDLMEIVLLALDDREKAEDIMEWLDITTAKEIVEVFLGISQFKKKISQMKNQSGETSLRA